MGTRRRRYSDSFADDSLHDEDTLNGKEPCDADPANTFKILVASDIHLGYCDNDTERGDDSFNTFEEILQIAEDEKVDFVLLGGDLFHENKPKPATLQRAIDLLRKYCLNDREVRFDHVSDPKVDFRHLEDPEVNFKNANINVGLPVFTIHGNHDDPVGSRKISAVDHLASAGLLNHFGMYDNLNEIDIRPLLLQKGTTKLALYGLGCMKDERLFRMFRDRKVRFLREEQELESWFNLFVLHQNRVKHGPKNYIPSMFLPSFLQLVIWGHEHECKITPEEEGTGSLDTEDGRNCTSKVYISQPGSSVATSLAPGEKEEKKIGILFIRGTGFQMKPMKLKTVRPFLMQDLYTSQILEHQKAVRDRDKFLEEYVTARVNELIEESADQLTGHNKQPVNPLIRIRIGYDHESEMFNPVRFAQKFVGKVANDNIVAFVKCPKKGEKLGSLDVADLQELIMEEEDHDLEGHVEEIVETFFTLGRQNNERDKILEVLSEKGLAEAVKACVEKNDKEAVSEIVDSQIDKVIKHLLKKNVDKDTIDEELEAFRDARNATQDEEAAEARHILDRIERLKTKRAAGTRGDQSNGAQVSRVADSDEEMDRDEQTISSDDEVQIVAPARGRGRGSRGPRGGRAASNTSTRGTRATGRGRSSSSRQRSGF